METIMAFPHHLFPRRKSGEVGIRSAQRDMDEGDDDAVCFSL
jgi:hypothetical protein